jgi:hypothetical protein
MAFSQIGAQLEQNNRTGYKKGEIMIGALSTGTGQTVKYPNQK